MAIGIRQRDSIVRGQDLEVIAPNFKRRLSGVTSTIVQLVPIQRKMGVKIAAFGSGLPDSVPRIGFRQLFGLLRRPESGFRVWHARRNVEMIGGLILRDLFRAPIKLLFTSASQRNHKWLSRFLIRRMDAVIATSHKTASYLNVSNTVVMHGIDNERFSPLSEQEKQTAKIRLGFDPHVKIVGCFGRIRHQKGTDLFVDTMIRLLPDRPDWIAIIPGRTTAEHQKFEQGLRERIEDAGLKDRILFVGEHRNIERWYQILSLFIAPQRWEGFGLTPLEAMSCGVPVVAADVGAFSELIVEGETGTIIERNQLDKMVGATARYLDDDSLRKRASQASIDHVRRNFPLEKEAQNLINIYRKLMSDGKTVTNAMQK